MKFLAHLTILLLVSVFAFGGLVHAEWEGEPKPSWWPESLRLYAGAGSSYRLHADEQADFLELINQTEDPSEWRSIFEAVEYCANGCTEEESRYVRNQYINWGGDLVDHPELYPGRDTTGDVSNDGSDGESADGTDGESADGTDGESADGTDGESADGTDGESAGTGKKGGALVNPLGSIDSLEEFLTAIMKGIVTIGSILLTLAIVWVGFKFVVAQGNEEKLKEARGAFLWVVIGGLILLGAQAISLVIQETVGKL